MIAVIRRRFWSSIFFLSADVASCYILLALVHFLWRANGIQHRRNVKIREGQCSNPSLLRPNWAFEASCSYGEWASGIWIYGNAQASRNKDSVPEDADEVQSLILEMQKSSSQFFPVSMSREDHVASLSLIRNDRNFHEIWEMLHPGFSKFYIKATEVFIERNFQE